MLLLAIVSLLHSLCLVYKLVPDKELTWVEKTKSKERLLLP